MEKPVIKVREGLLQGVEEKSNRGKTIYRFRGIPFAEPPIGSLRFKSPIPVKAWTGIKDATCEKPPCCQIERDPGPLLPSHDPKEGMVYDCPTGKMISNIFNGEEDCLYLNIHTPELPLNYNTPLPVMVYFHGGGFVGGSAAAMYFGGDLLVEKGVVFVSVTYRLGVLGFLSLDIPEVPGNAGLRDQNVALAWIKRNIQSFNGDPNNITIFGISAGSASVEYQMISPLSKGLFNKTMLLAGSCMNPWAFSDNHEKINQTFIKKLGITEKDPTKVVKALQAIDAKTLVTIATNECSDDDDVARGHLFGFVPSVEKRFDGVAPFLDKNPYEILSSGDFDTSIPVVCGFSTAEGDFFKPCIPKNMDLSFLDKYYEKEKDKLGEFLSDLLFLEGIHRGIDQRLAKNVNQFVYLTSYEGDMGFYMKMVTGTDRKECGHGFDMLYLSENIYIVEKDVNENDKKIRNLFLELWTNFAKHGHPTPVALESGLVWEPYSKSQLKILNISENSSMIDNPFAFRINQVRGKI